MVQKAAEAIVRLRTPNLRLRHERELRGWSQQYVAEQIDAARYYVSRWETGFASPSPYFRRKLCELFGKDANELGLIQGGNSAQQSAQSPVRASVSPILGTFLYDPTIPPPVSRGLVGRDELLGRLKERLFAGRSLALLALNGLPGVGKTALAITLAHDSEIQEHFRDGILWAGLGYQPNIMSLLSRWGALLGIEPAEKANVEDWTKAIHAIIGLRCMLLVIDDAWSIEEALIFKIGGPNCAYLVTTRFPDIAGQFDQDGATVVRELSENDSVTLLARLAPEVVANKPDQVRTVVRSVGGLPLALTLMGNYLRMQAHNGQPRRLHETLERLQHAEERLRLVQPQAPVERSPNLRPDTPLSLHIMLDMSYRYLDEQAQYAFQALSVFPAKPNTFSEEAALAICAVAVETLDRLTSAGLLEGNGSDRYMLHQTIADFASIHLSDPAVEERMVTFFVSYMEARTTDYNVLELESSNILAALKIAFKQRFSTSLVRGALAFAPFLEARGLYIVAETHLQRALQAAQTLGDEIGLAHARLHLGRIAERRGDLTQAEQLYQEGLSVARKIGHQETMSALLASRGEVALSLGEAARAEHYLQEGLAKAREIEHWQTISTLLINLGALEFKRRRYAQAEELYKESLGLARMIGYRAELSSALQILGKLEVVRGNYAQAEEYLQESLQVAHEIRHRWLMSRALSELGEFYLKQQKFDAASMAFDQALTTAQEIDAPLPIALARYGLAQIAFAQGNYLEARRQGEESLALFRSMGYEKGSQVAQWLDEVPIML